MPDSDHRRGRAARHIALPQIGEEGQSKKESDESLDDCAGNGVFAPIPGVLGTMMAVETLKISAGVPVEFGKLSLYDAIASEWSRVGIRKRKYCPGCAGAS